MQTYKWTIEIEVDEAWIADGFDMDDERATDMLGLILGWATPDEFSAKVLKAPPAKAIRKAQGYKHA